MLDYENAANPLAERKMTISKWKKRANVDTGKTKSILEHAREFQDNGIKAKDALHLASAIVLGCVFLSRPVTIYQKNSKGLALGFPNLPPLGGGRNCFFTIPGGAKCFNFEKIKELNPLTFAVRTK